MIKKVVFPFILLLSAACAPTDQEQSATVSTPTIKPTARGAYVYTEGSTKVIRGALKTQDLEARYDKETQTMTLQGGVHLKPYDGSPALDFDVSLFGTLNGDSIALKRVHLNDSLPEGLRVAAKATCLGDDDCEDSFIDIYLEYKGSIYHHQIETTSIPDIRVRPVDRSKTVSRGISLPGISKKSGKSLEVHELDDTTHLEVEDDGDDDSRPLGPYIGDLKGDIENILNAPEVPKNPTPLKLPPSEGKTEPSSPTWKGFPYPQVPAEKPPKTEVVPVIVPTATPPTKEPLKPTLDQPKSAPAEPVKPAPVEAPKPAAPVSEKPAKEEVKTETQTEATVPESSNSNADEQKGGLTFDMNRKIRQVIDRHGRPYKLENAVSLLEYQQSNDPTGFNIAYPRQKRFYAANEIIYLIARMGQFTKKNLENHTLRVGDISKQGGGRLSGHLSHRTGLDVDLAYYFKDPKQQGGRALTSKNYPRSDWLINEQWALFKDITSTGLVERIFVHRSIKRALCRLAIKNGEVNKKTTSGLAYETLWRLQPRHSDHADHYHVRAKCSSIQIGCRPKAEPTGGMGCF